MLPLHETLPCVHPQLRRKTPPSQGEYVFTVYVELRDKTSSYIGHNFHPSANKMLIFAIKLLQQGGVLSLIDCTLIEEPDASDEECKFTATVTECFHVVGHTGSSYWLI